MPLALIAFSVKAARAAVLGSNPTWARRLARIVGLVCTLTMAESDGEIVSIEQLIDHQHSGGGINPLSAIGSLIGGGGGGGLIGIQLCSQLMSPNSPSRASTQVEKQRFGEHDAL